MFHVEHPTPEEIPVDLPKTLDDVLASSPRGWPRPITDGLPTPWIARQGDLGDVDVFRRAACVMLRLCQVCGLELGITARIYWRPGDRVVIDGAAVHPDHCAALAERHCPELRKLDDAGRLRHATVLTATLVPVDAGGFATETGMPRAYAVPTV
jgi:hypothetical protein